MSQHLMNPVSRLLVAAGLMAACLPLFAQEAAAPAAAASEPAAAPSQTERKPVQLEEVIVTAQKTATLASKTPVALSVVSGDDLKSAGVTDPRSLMDIVPGVQIAQESGKLEIAIRGVVSLDETEKGDPSAAFNVDGAYVARGEAQTGSFLDLNRIEVLRGPQGTLYGRNATAGAVNLITNKPEDKFDAKVEVEVGNYGESRVEGMINVPINDVLSLRAAVSGNRRDTYLNPGPNTGVPLESKDDRAGRVHLLAKFTPDTSLLLTVENSHQGGGGATPVPMGNFFTGTYIGTLPFSPANTGNDIENPVYVDRGTRAQLTTGLAFEQVNAHRNNTTNAARGEFKTNLGFAELTYQLSYMRTKVDELQNGTYFGFPLNGIINGDGSNTANEVRLNSVGQGPLKWVVGVYHFREEVIRDTTYNTYVTAPFGSFVVNVPYLPVVNNESKAAFGQATYSLLPSTRLTLGLRETHDEKSGHDPLGGVPAVAPATTSTGAYDVDVKYSNTSWKVGLDHDLAPGTMLFASVSTGYKAGGFNDSGSAGTYKPEHLTAYEGGIKTKLFENTVELSASVFHYQYKDMQLTAVVCPTADPASCGSLTTNAASSKVDGAELEGRWLITGDDQLAGSLALTNARFDDYQPNSTTDWSGQHLDRAPTSVLALRYSHSFGLQNGSDVTAAIGTRLSSSYFISDPSAAIRYQQPTFHKSDVSLTWTSATGKTSVGLFAKNLENKITIESTVPGSFFVGDPRTYGLRASFAY